MKLKKFCVSFYIVDWIEIFNFVNSFINKETEVSNEIVFEDNY